MNILIIIFLVALSLGLITLLWLTNVAFRRSSLWGVLVFLLSPITAILFAFGNWYDARKAFTVYIIATFSWIGVGGYIVYEVGYSNIKEITARLFKKEISYSEASVLINKGLSDSGVVDLFAVKEVDDEVVLDEYGEPIPSGLLSDANSYADQENAEGNNTLDAAEANTGISDATVTEDKPTADVDSDKDGMVSEVAPTNDYPDFDNVQPDPLAIKKQKREIQKTKISYSKLAAYKGKFFHVHTHKGTVHKGELKKITKNYIVIYREIYSGSVEFKIYKKQIKTLYQVRAAK